MCAYVYSLLFCAINYLGYYTFLRSIEPLLLFLKVIMSTWSYSLFLFFVLIRLSNLKGGRMK